MNVTISRSRLQTRYRVQGKLILETALHLGGGRNPAKGTDSPVIRDGFGRPFIPGSSIKGAVRAAVERIVPTLNINACGLYDRTADCLSALPENHPPRLAYGVLQKSLGQKASDSKEIKEAISTLLTEEEKKQAGLSNSQEITEDLLLLLLDRHLCQVCKTFGSPFLASVIFFHDAAVDVEQWVGITQVRDGVGIDRDSGRAVDKLKYDYEIVPPETAFDFSMTIETDDPLSLGLAAVGLNELVNGNIPLGGIRSRGLGRCRLDADNTTVKSVNLGEMEALKAYLTKGETQSQPVKEFIDNHIQNLWK